MATHDYLRSIQSPAALDWARKRSEVTVARFVDKPLQERMLAALNTDDRIPLPRRRGELLFNFWRDAEHPRGVWRTTTLESYLGETKWRTLIDVDSLAASEQENWVWKGAHVRSPFYDRALIKLSRGGADATEIREFDLVTGEFVPGGFRIPEAKTDVSWLDRDTLLIGTDMGEGSLTESGYPAQVYMWRRGESLAEASLYFQGERSDVAVGGWHDSMPGFERTFVTRSLDFYRSQTYLDRDGLQLIDIPEDCGFSSFREWMFLAPRTEFAGIPAGGLGVIGFEEFLAGSRTVTPVFLPTDSTSLQGLAFTKDFAVLSLLDNVASRIVSVPLGRWSEHSTVLDGLASIAVTGTSPLRDNEIWLTTTSFDQPTTLLHGHIGELLHEVKHSPELFRSDDMATRQHWATSADGTRIPYFITGRFTDQPAPCLVHAYGGFEVSLRPYYSALRGIGWLEQGGLFVEANLRGGGEFGPQWHSQVVKGNRHKVWEDHRAVIEDIVLRGYATKESLAIRGGSNGGLLTAGALVQYPHLLGAVVSQVPLTDMLNYHTMSAGASWMAEYGNPEEDSSIKEWSPLEGVDKRVPYPPCLVTTSTRDDRVHPAHARLFAAALEDAGQPVDYYENIEGGHAGAADNEQTAFVEALIYNWLWSNLKTQ
ncbi:Prolyl endopeptidase [Corynebacterium kalinowskii]|uniref:Prolyl endopeptidase n=1 Tax=Corynebacterium kalinowskii TaxID=2675216 RepID=A0A6B8VTP3_9CORY|nr:prolyl oligopeptidase family serine peptidase [Corynebacterium kalinowskii]QGU02987.1 Prolyl endopeptidase [Corynebacterium kalinowskii]